MAFSAVPVNVLARRSGHLFLSPRFCGVGGGDGFRAVGARTVYAGGKSKDAPRVVTVPVPGRHYTTKSGDYKPLLLYTSGTPNGRKVSIFLEELKLEYGLEYDTYPIDISKNTQKEPWYLAMNPNGRIPVLVDRARISPSETQTPRVVDHGHVRNEVHNTKEAKPLNHSSEGQVVFETGAILIHLAKWYDLHSKFSFDYAREPAEWSETLQWIFWAHGGLGPMQGQSNHFQHFAPEDIPYTKKSLYWITDWHKSSAGYLEETKRLFGVLELRLAGGREFLAGGDRGKYSIADMNAYPWIRGHQFSGIGTLDQWPALKEWFERISSRPGVQAGVLVPTPPS